VKPGWRNQKRGKHRPRRGIDSTRVIGLGAGSGTRASLNQKNRIKSAISSWQRTAAAFSPSLSLEGYQCPLVCRRRALPARGLTISWFALTPTRRPAFAISPAMLRRFGLEADYWRRLPIMSSSPKPRSEAWSSRMHFRAPEPAAQPVRDPFRRGTGRQGLTGVPGSVPKPENRHKLLILFGTHMWWTQIARAARQRNLCDLAPVSPRSSPQFDRLSLTLRRRKLHLPTVAKPQFRDPNALFSRPG